MNSEHTSFSTRKREQEHLILQAARTAAKEATLLTMERNRKLDDSIAESIISRVEEELQGALERLRETSESLSSRLEESQDLLDVVLLDEGPEPINVIRELRDRDIASLAELKDAMEKGTFKVARDLHWEEANKLAKKLLFWKADVLIVPAGTRINTAEESKERSRKDKRRRRRRF